MREKNETEQQNSALVLFSGGQDSTTCLAWALTRFDTVETLGIAYGQRHAVELACRQEIRARLRSAFPAWGAKLGEDHTLTLDAIRDLSDSALTGNRDITATDGGLPTTFVPGRNLIFLTFAAALAYQRNLRHLVGGMCETDYSGYPDCRDDTLKALQVAINLGMNSRFVVQTPLMWLDKAETWALADSLGGSALLQIVIECTHTCYRGDRSRRHPWGFGCGDCPACQLRAAGYQRFAVRAGCG